MSTPQLDIGTVFASSVPSYREKETDGIRIDRHSHCIRFLSQQVSCDSLKISAYIHTLDSVHMESEVLFLSLKSYVSLSEILEIFQFQFQYGNAGINSSLTETRRPRLYPDGELGHVTRVSATF